MRIEHGWGQENVKILGVPALFIFEWHGASTGRPGSFMDDLRRACQSLGNMGGQKGRGF